MKHNIGEILIRIDEEKYNTEAVLELIKRLIPEEVFYDLKIRERL